MSVTVNLGRQITVAKNSVASDADKHLHWTVKMFHNVTSVFLKKHLTAKITQALGRLNVSGDEKLVILFDLVFTHTSIWFAG